MLPAGMDSSIHSAVFTRHERSVLEIEHCADDVRNVTHPSEGMKFRKRILIVVCVHWVFTFPGDTVFTRMPLAAYSNAKALLTAGMVDFESTARRAGTLPLGWSARTAEMFTMCPEFCFFICGITCFVMKK
jgi:hypothetical protein